MGFIANRAHALPGIDVPGDTLELAIEPGYAGIGMMDKEQGVPFPKRIQVNDVVMYFDREICCTGKANVVVYWYRSERHLLHEVAIKFRRLETVLGAPDPEPTDALGLLWYQGRPGAGAEKANDADIVAIVAIVLPIYANAFLGKRGDRLRWERHGTRRGSTFRAFQYALSFMEVVGSLRTEVRQRYATHHPMSGRYFLPTENWGEFLTFVEELGTWLLSIFGKKLTGYGDIKAENIGVGSGGFVLLDVESCAVASVDRFGVSSKLALLRCFKKWGNTRIIAQGDDSIKGFGLKVETSRITGTLRNFHDSLCAPGLPGFLVGRLVLTTPDTATTLTVEMSSITGTLRNFDDLLGVPGLPGFLVRRLVLTTPDTATAEQLRQIHLLEEAWNKEITRALGNYERDAISMVLLDLLVNCGSKIFAGSGQNAGAFLAGRGVSYLGTKEDALARLHALFVDVGDIKNRRPSLWAMLSEPYFMGLYEAMKSGDVVETPPVSDKKRLSCESGPKPPLRASEPKRIKRAEDLVCREPIGSLGV